MKEYYFVKLSHPQPDGYWKWGETIQVEVEAEEDNPKDNHELAEQLTRKQYPGCIVHSVTYI